MSYKIVLIVFELYTILTHLVGYISTDFQSILQQLKQFYFKLPFDPNIMLFSLRSTFRDNAAHPENHIVFSRVLEDRWYLGNALRTITLLSTSGTCSATTEEERRHSRYPPGMCSH